MTPATGVRRVRVGLLTGCIQQVAFGPQNQATARVLARNGAEVIAPRTQACCGALHAHAGEHETALALARRTIETFEAAGVEHVIVNTSGLRRAHEGLRHAARGRSGLARARGALRARACATSPSSSPPSRCAGRCAR